MRAPFRDVEREPLLRARARRRTTRRESASPAAGRRSRRRSRRGAAHELRLLVRRRLEVQPAQRPARRLCEMLHWASSVSSPCSANSSRPTCARRSRARPRALGLDHAGAARASSATNLIRRASDELAARERLGVTARRDGLHARAGASARGTVSASNQCLPAWLGKCRSSSVELLARRASSVSGTKTFGAPEVAVELRDLVLEDQVVAERVPGQLAGEPVILVEVVAARA